MNISWKDITKGPAPKEGKLIVAKGPIGYNGVEEDVYTGYWNEEENALTQFKDPAVGWKYSFTHWFYASDLQEGVE